MAHLWNQHLRWLVPSFGLFGLGTFLGIQESAVGAAACGIGGVAWIVLLLVKRDFAKLPE